MSNTARAIKGTKVRTDNDGYSGRRWWFVLNNPQKDFPEMEEELDLSAWGNMLETKKELFHYLKAGLERGKQGTLHIQGYIETVKPQRASGVRSIIGKRAKPGLSFGTPEAASDYCGKIEKSGNVYDVLEIGELFNKKTSSPRQSGADRLWELKGLIDEGKSWPELWQIAFPLMVRNYRGIAVYYNSIHHKNPIVL